ncbi:hypothetical protein AB3S75_029817 [Citrus x aurantiifolia]
MIKRRFYRAEHGDRDDAADSSSSDSDSELEPQASEESEDEAVEQVKENGQACLNSSGYESEDSSAEEMNVASPGNQLRGKCGANEIESETTAEKASMPADFPDCVLQIKSIFRCRICPRILCLNEETIRAHLNSKRHVRSEKLLKENRLMAILNDDGEIENQETAAEMNARIIALSQDKPKSKNKRRQGKRNLSRKEKVHEDSIKKNAKQLTQGPAKKRHKSEK